MNRNILIIDDSKALAEGLADILRMEGCHVTIVTNGVTAKSFLQKQIPDLIITDLVMPEMNGMEFIQMIRREPGFTRLPIIAVSADNREERAVEVREAGANLFFAKPFDECSLIEAIEKLTKPEFI